MRLPMYRGSGSNVTHISEALRWVPVCMHVCDTTLLTLISYFLMISELPFVLYQSTFVGAWSLFVQLSVTQATQAQYLLDGPHTEVRPILFHKRLACCSKMGDFVVPSVLVIWTQWLACGKLGRQINSQPTSQADKQPLCHGPGNHSMIFS